jgi:hypothetical protein
MHRNENIVVTYFLPVVSLKDQVAYSLTVRATTAIFGH